MKSHEKRIGKCLEFAINALMQKTLGPAQERIEMAIPALRDAHILSCVDSTPPDSRLDKVREALEALLGMYGCNCGQKLCSDCENDGNTRGRARAALVLLDSNDPPTNEDKSE